LYTIYLALEHNMGRENLHSPKSLSKSNWTAIIGVINVIVENERRLIKTWQYNFKDFHVGVSHESVCETCIHYKM
jgi:hypothetical protein